MGARFRSVSEPSSTDNERLHFPLPIIEFEVFVGYWSAQNTVVVAHQGTDPVKL